MQAAAQAAAATKVIHTTPKQQNMQGASIRVQDNKCQTFF
jgi:hypothetical protein